MHIFVIVLLYIIAYIIGGVIAAIILLHDDEIKTIDDWKNLNDRQKFCTCGPALVWFILLPILIIVCEARTFLRYTCGAVSPFAS